MLDAAQPADEQGQPAPRNAIGQQEVQLFVLDEAVDPSTRRHRNVIVVIVMSCACNSVHSEDSVTNSILYYAAGACALAVLFPKLRARLRLSRAKHRSLAGHSRMARRFASVVPRTTNTTPGVSSAPSVAPDDWPQRVVRGFTRPRGRSCRAIPRDGAPHGRHHRRRLRPAIHVALSGTLSIQPFRPGALPKAGVFLRSSSGVTVTDLDGNRFYDLAGSYGVNVFGYDFYKECIARGSERVRDLGPVLGAYHPITAYNIRRLVGISGLDEISFHMSGTEAVMQAVRLARYHTGRSRLVRFLRRLPRVVG